MDSSTQEAVASAPKVRFNFNKLHAVVCIALSSAVSIGLIVWVAEYFL